MMTLAKQQHYIPQFYLNYFGKRRKKSHQIWCYDLKDEKAYLTSVGKIAREKDYYNVDVSDDCFISLEESLSKIERFVAPAYANLVRHMNPRALRMEERVFIAAFCATLLTRVPRFGEEQRAIEDQIRDKLGDNNEVYKKLKMSDNQLKAFAKNMLDTSLMQFTPILCAMQWTIGLAKLHAFVHTSDNPFLRHNPCDSGLRGNLGLLCKGIQLALPLTPFLVLYMYYENDYPRQGDFLFIDNDNALHIKSMLLYNATRYLFAQNECDFFIEKELRKKKVIFAKPT